VAENPVFSKVSKDLACVQHVLSLFLLMTIAAVGNL
jgi:hypothetical protein